jgi:hypothetical protein
MTKSHHTDTATGADTDAVPAAVTAAVTVTGTAQSSMFNGDSTIFFNAAMNLAPVAPSITR